MSDGQRRFSEDAYKWLQNYHGSIDATALLLAYDAGARETRKEYSQGSVTREEWQAVRDKLQKAEDAIVALVQLRETETNVVQFVRETEKILDTYNGRNNG